VNFTDENLFDFSKKRKKNRAGQRTFWNDMIAGKRATLLLVSGSQMYGDGKLPVL
jgi:hypothetical protein